MSQGLPIDIYVEIFESFIQNPVYMEVLNSTGVGGHYSRVSYLPNHSLSEICCNTIITHQNSFSLKIKMQKGHVHV